MIVARILERKNNPMPFTFEKQSIPDLILIRPRLFGDERGFFMETYKRSEFEEHGISFDFKQDNHSKSERGVLRGLHYQLEPVTQGKLVRVVRGAVYDVAVDIRQGSPTFGKYVGVTLTEDGREMFWIPPGFAHGFVALEDGTEFLYKTTGEYSPEHERAIRYDDPQIGISWPLKSDHIKLSEKDKEAPFLSEADNNFKY